MNATLSSLSLPPWPAGFDWSSVSCIFFRSSFRLLYASYPASPVRRFLSIFTGRVRSDPKKCAEYSHKIRFRMILSFVWNGRIRCENCAEYSPKIRVFLTFESCAEYFGDWFVYFCLENVQFARNDPLVDVFILVLKVARNVVRVGERQRQVNRQVCGLNLFFFFIKRKERKRRQQPSATPVPSAPKMRNTRARNRRMASEWPRWMTWNQMYRHVKADILEKIIIKVHPVGLVTVKHDQVPPGGLDVTGCRGHEK